MPTNHMTLTQIGLIAASRADMLVDNAGNTEISAFIDAGAAAVAVNSHLAALWDAIILAYEDYCVRRIKVDVKADFENYPLPEDFYKFRKVFPIVNGKRGKPLRKFDLQDLGQEGSLDTLITSSIEDTRYKVNGFRLWLHPMPTGPAQLELWYVPQFDPIVTFEEPIDIRFPMGWEEYVIAGVAAEMLEKEESDSTALRNAQRAALERILIMAEDRDVGEPFQIIG